jgi:hypothetical protein
MCRVYSVPLPSVKTFTLRFLPILSASLLLLQISIPWSVKHLLTQDGSAHVYTASVTTSLLFHRQSSPYRPVYRIQKTALPNWIGTLLLAAFINIFGPDHAEAFLMSLCLLLGYFGFAYCARSLTPEAGVPLILGNCLLQVWFLWGGFYNFYLGMGLFLLLTGYYIRRAAAFTWLRTATVSLGLVIVFFTHLIPAILSGVTLVILALWMHRGWKPFARLLLALSPTVLLTALYAAKFHKNTPFTPEILNALRDFPQLTFAFAGGWTGEQRIFWPLVLLMIAMALASMKRSEWKTAKGGVASVAGIMFLLYLLVPDIGFGGSVVKMRFAWGFFLLGGLLVCTVDRLRNVQAPLGAVLTVLLVLHLRLVASHAKATSDAAEQYLQVMDQLPEGARFVRLFYPAPVLEHRSGTDQLAFNPLQHLDELAAVRRSAIDLSAYQPATGTFSVTFRPAIDSGQGGSLWAFESPNAQSWASLDWLRNTLPVSIDYVVLFGEQVPAEREGCGTLVNTGPGSAFARIYHCQPPPKAR